MHKLFLFACIFFTVLSAFAFDYIVVGTNPYGCFDDVDGIVEPVRLWSEIFDSAKKTIDISAFYMLHYSSFDGEPIEEIYDRLERATERGVKVRIILDYPVFRDNGDTYKFTPLRFARLDNAQVRFIFLRFGQGENDDSYGIMHAKYFVVDSFFTYIGSHNWSFGAMFENRELGVLISDSAFAKQVLAVFSRDWEKGFSYGEVERSILIDEDAVDDNVFSDDSLMNMYKDADSSLIFLVESAPKELDDPGIPNSEQALVWLSESACSLIEIEVNTFNSKRLAYSLLRAAKRGVKVKMIIDGAYYHNNKPFFKKLNNEDNVEIRPADIRVAGKNKKNGTVHSKFMIVDKRWGYIGSSTFSTVQLRHYRNLGLVFNSKTLAEKCHRFFMSGWTSRCVFNVK